jgi:hypothetical protein
MVADTVAEVVADGSYSIEPCHQGITIAGRQPGAGLQSLFEHSDQRIEITVILIPDIVAESCSTFAVEHHQLRETSRFANSFSVAGDGVFGLDDGRVLALQHIRPEPAVQRFFVRRENVLAQSEAGVKKRPIVLVGRLEILNQAQQSQPVEACKFRLNIYPRRL